MEKVRCFFDVEVDGVPLGRIIFELFNDTTPKTCENFRALCTGELGEGQTTGKPLHYRNVKFHRVIKDFMVQAGDFSAGNGTGGESIYGGQFEDENFELKHDTPFLLSMANRGKDTNGSQFFITTQTASHLDGKHVVFGRVINGQEVVVAIENLPVDNRSRPLQQALISNCGELILQRSGKMKTKEKKKKKVEVSSDSEDEKKKSKKKKKEKRTKKDKVSEEGEIDETATETEVQVKAEVFRPHPLAPALSTIDPEEIPEVPKNRFLDRGYQNRLTNSDAPVNQQGRVRSKVKGNQFFTRSGRKVKGRGSLRYRTPSRSRSRSRSMTPPHWKQAQRRTVTYEKYQRETEIQQEREREIEDRRRRREERHRQMGEEDEESGEERGLDGMIQSVVDQKKFNSKDLFPITNRGQDDKTNRDWRVARHETTLENKENKMRPSNGRADQTKDPEQDLRLKLRDRFVNQSSVKSRLDKSTMKDDEELDENALDFEAPSDNDENEPSNAVIEAPPPSAAVDRRDRFSERRHPPAEGDRRRYDNSRRGRVFEDRRPRRTEMARYRPPHKVIDGIGSRNGRRNPRDQPPRHSRRNSRSRSRNRGRREHSRERRREKSSSEKRTKNRKKSRSSSSGDSN